MAGEGWARRILRQELKREVVIHDDNSAPAMYDLRVGATEAPEIAVECVGAVNPDRAETWNIGPAKGPWHLATSGDWIVELAPGASIKGLKRRLGPLLQELEKRGLFNTRAGHQLARHEAALSEELQSLGITHAFCSDRSGKGKVHLTMTGFGGSLDRQGTQVAGWIAEFLRDRAREDVLRKLERSGAPERHAFVIVDFGGAPPEIEMYLLDPPREVPAASPDLPAPVTGVWIVSGFGAKGVRWDGTAWRLFEARGPGIEGPPPASL